MFERIKTSFLYGNYFCGIEHISKENESIIYTTVLKKNKKEVDISDSFSSKSVKEVVQKLSKKQHVCLIINNEHVLTKSLVNEPLDNIKLVNKAFPNINIAEFYYEIIQQGKTCFISICRKAYVDSLIKTYTDLNIYVINFSFGNSIISSIVKYMDSDSISTSNVFISVKNDFVDTLDLNENINEIAYNINDLNTTNTYLLSLSAGLTSIINTFKPITSFQEKKNELTDTFKQVRFFSQFIKVGLVFILSLLLVNFLFFNFYFNEVNALNETSQLNQTTKNKIIKLNEEVSKAQKMTDDMLKSSVSKSSFYINEIVNSLPESILLSEINYQPLIKNIKKDKAIVLNQNIIIVTGTSSNSILYSEWVTLLETINCIDKVEVETYSDSKTTSNFSLKITLSNDT